MKRIFIIVCLLLAGLLNGQDNAVVRVRNIPDIQADPGSSHELALTFAISDGWHINSAGPVDDYSIPTKITLSAAEGIRISGVRYPGGEIKSLSWGGDLSLYEGEITIPVVISVDPSLSEGERRLDFKLSYQACNDITCLPPRTLSFSARLVVLPESGAEQAAPEVPSDNLSQTEQETEPAPDLVENEKQETTPFQNKSMLLILLIVFVMGLALNLTPCVYPLIPITMSYFIAQKDTRSPVLLSIMYVLGLAVTYSIIGTLAAFGGSMMGSLLAHPATLIFFSVLMLALSLSMFGLYEFRLPNALTQAGGGSRSGAAGALIMGLTMGVVAAPCVGPFIVSLLGFVAQRGSVFIGFLTFFVLALGLGVPYLFLGIFSTKISSLPRSGEWLNGIRIFFGLALVGMAIYFILPLLPAPLKGLILPVFMIAAAVYYGVFDRSGISIPWFSRLKVVLSMIVLAAGILMLKPVSVNSSALNWDTYSPERITAAAAENKPVMIDFYADWCNPCKELEHITFTDPRVRKLLGDVVLLKVDVTLSTASSQSIMDRYGIVGVPTIVFLDDTGAERRDLRLNGFEKPAAFAARLESILLK
ncbi:MAG: protein-disulfide reductase DsbD [Candidatus Marinimicrobia bacterium]|nr:protein-disulfide reductase DsbD [Candidatus Neomarinimicrobiota bacterium]